MQCKTLTETKTETSGLNSDMSEPSFPKSYPKIVPLSALVACNAMNWPGGDALSFSYRFHHWLLLYTLGQYIVNVQSGTTSDGFSTIFIFGIWLYTCLCDQAWEIIIQKYHHPTLHISWLYHCSLNCWQVRHPRSTSCILCFMGVVSKHFYRFEIFISFPV